jgi:hypothetical protein
MFFVLKFELILIIGPNNVLTEGARKVYRGRRVGQGWSSVFVFCFTIGPNSGHYEQVMDLLGFLKAGRLVQSSDPV